MSDIKICPVAPQDFIKWWLIVEPLLNAALPVMAGRYLAIDILALLISDPSYQGWFVIEDDNLLAVIVTQVVVYPRCNTLNMFLVSGDDMTRWFDQCADLMSKYGKTKNCRYFECSGRPGWQRKLNLAPRSWHFVKEI